MHLHSNDAFLESLDAPVRHMISQVAGLPLSLMLHMGSLHCQGKRVAEAS
jgi:hypothetical protein